MDTKSDPESIALAKAKIRLAKTEMQGLTNLEKHFAERPPLLGLTIIGCVTPTVETAVFIMTLRNLGASITWCSDNQFAPDDSIIAFLKEQGIPIWAESNMDDRKYLECMEQASKILDYPCSNALQIVDDGADLTEYLLNYHPHRLTHVQGISEQTTCGVKKMEKFFAENRLNIPVVNVNDCFTKRFFDNYYGVRESFIHSFMLVTAMQIAAKVITVFGYGPVGKGTCEVLKALGARVCVVETDILKLLQASFDGFEVVDATTAMHVSDICITATGTNNTICRTLLEEAKDGMILCNIGHGRLEYDTDYLLTLGNRVIINQHLDQFTLRSGRTIYSTCNGALTNLIAGRGNPAKVMGLTFCLQALAQIELFMNRFKYQVPGLYQFPENLERLCVELSFPLLKDKVHQAPSNQKLL